MSDISTRKIRTFFRRFDLNRDGTLTRAEFLSMGDGLADMEKFDPKQRETFHEHLDNLFTCFVSGLKGHRDVLTEDSFVESLKSQGDNPLLKKCLADTLFSAISPMDVNDDGYLDAEEYRRLFENFGVVESEFTKAAFDAIDTDHDGKLSFEEFEKALIDYMCSDDESSTGVLGLLN